ncbi:hypothetical protein U9M48_038470 [Paspalum notatum var. saurae]|uniref:BHLH domain-containing protein n=1 Tax=Paspalum notatum var. saurae TaxID=547442 RepID=A0AAQ3UHM8_PASNO
MDSFAWAQTAGLTGGSAVTDERGGGFLPPMLGFQLPPTAAGLELFMDSGLVQRSCFGAGNGAPTASPSCITAPEEPSGHRSKTTSTTGNDNAEPEFVGGGVYDDAPGIETAAPRGDCSGQERDSKKRRSSNENVHETDHDQGMASNASADSSNECADDTAAAAAAASGKKKGKGPKASADDSYIHVRARKGQATNRHSLAERLRREKISERMKLLQDLVPGCSKVTGKAVMLDEIINYVQSLQRQVEFLSMKLAAVNPQLGLNIKGLLSKDHIRFPGAPSSAHNGFSFSHEMMPKLPPLSQSGMLQGGVHGVAISNGFRTVMEDQLNGKDSVGEHLSQMPLALDGPFHDAAQTAYRAIGGPEHLSLRPDQDRFHM